MGTIVLQAMALTSPFQREYSTSCSNDSGLQSCKSRNNQDEIFKFKSHYKELTKVDDNLSNSQQFKSVNIKFSNIPAKELGPAPFISPRTNDFDDISEKTENQISGSNTFSDYNTLDSEREESEIDQGKEKRFKNIKKVKTAPYSKLQIAVNQSSEGLDDSPKFLDLTDNDETPIEILESSNEMMRDGDQINPFRQARLDAVRPETSRSLENDHIDYLYTGEVAQEVDTKIPYIDKIWTKGETFSKVTETVDEPMLESSDLKLGLTKFRKIKKKIPIETVVWEKKLVPSTRKVYKKVLVSFLRKVEVRTLELKTEKVVVPYKFSSQDGQMEMRAVADFEESSQHYLIGDTFAVNYGLGYSKEIRKQKRSLIQDS